MYVHSRPAGHAHVNWVFSTPGQYRIGFQASGVLAKTGVATTSEIVEYLFDVEYAPILSVTRKEAATLTLNWLSRMDHEYHLESTTNFANGPWQAHLGVAPVEGTGNMLSVEVPVAEGLRFFRLEMRGKSDSITMKTRTLLVLSMLTLATAARLTAQCYSFTQEHVDLSIIWNPAANQLSLMASDDDHVGHSMPATSASSSARNP